MPDRNTANLVADSTPKERAPELDDFWSRALLKRLTRLKHGRLTLVSPAKSVRAFGAPGAEPAVSLAIHAPNVARRLVFNGSLGFAESYMDGDWDSSDLVALVMLAIANERALGFDNDGHILPRLFERVRHAINRNSRRGSQRNIAYHYDLGHAFY